MSAPVVHLRDVQKRLPVFTVWERRRNSTQVHWAIECFAEAFGVFFYVYFGVGSQVAWIFGNIIKEVGFSSLFQIGIGYAFGILFALSVCAGTSGGHFNPCVTIAMCVFKGFPKAKAVRYIFFQILGAYLGCLVVYTQWKAFIDVAEGALLEAKLYASTQFTPNGPAGAFGNYLLAPQTLPRIFMNEFVNCFLVASVIWASLDPTNLIVPPTVGTFIVAFAYAASIFGFGVPGVSLNAARDIGGRLAAMSIWGMAAKGGPYGAISALVNIPATLLAAFVYEMFLTDSDRVVGSGNLEFLRAHAHHARFGHGHGGEKQDSRDSDDKPSIEKFENSSGIPTSHV
jgi:glycerol uptake facilitator-like aquaporin